MKNTSITLSALICASLLIAGTASAQLFKKTVSAQPSSSQTVWTQQSPTPPYPTVRTPVAGYSPNFAAPQPATKATLTTDANRLIRWEGWLDVDAFSVSILNQMQYRVENGGLDVGSFTITEPAILEAVLKAKASDPTFVMNPNLEEGAGANFIGTPKLFVWTYRHNFADKGLYQLYISAKGKMDIGTTLYGNGGVVIRHKDIQSLGYEFGDDGSKWTGTTTPHSVIVDIEVWRGAVARVNAKGVLEVVDGYEEAGVRVNYDAPPVAALPLSDWEKAPSLIGNPNYNPQRATGAAFVEPLERALTIRGNDVQLRAGDVQQRVRTVTPFRFRR